MTTATEVPADSELAATPTTDANLHLKELVVIHWACQLAEATAWALEQGSAGLPPAPEVARMIRQITDLAEHVAQSALEGGPLETRADFLQRDVGALLHVLNVHADWLEATRCRLPTRDALRAWQR